MELESDNYDVIVLGTGLAESIAAASLAKAGKTVLHLDPNDYYGGEQASLTLDELVEWSTNQSSISASSSSSSSASTGSVSYSRLTTTELTPSLNNDRRRYALSLFPSLLPSRGSLIDTLIASDVSKYVSFRLLDSVSVWDLENDEARRVPGSKEEVFKDKSVGLLDKRRLMKFLMFAGGEFEDDDLLKGKETQPLLDFLQESFAIPPSLATSITFAIAHCSSPQDETLPALIRTRRYLRSIGRYGPSPFLVGQYGGAGEVAQGFCRACAVFGGTYILGSSAKPESIETSDTGVTVKIPSHPRPVTASHLISSPNHLPPSISINSASSSSSSSGESKVTANCVAVLSSLPKALRRRKPVQPEDEVEKSEEGEEDSKDEENDDTAVILFPPEGEGSLVRAFVMGEGTGSCPPGQFILYLSTSATADTSPANILQPYLQRLSPEPLFEAYYLSHRSSAASSNSEPNPTSPVIVLRPYGDAELLTEGLDWEAKEGERAYYAIMGEGTEEGRGFFEKGESEEEEMGIGADDL
ncbi:hypothetical protein CI109_100977 [Kwoniella shandongensis]|uniref:Rab proteins geranylgeranyltransferase n=1 Tax=Kwoniella shandongensis TaxID=1734106 RepID=A0A5M6C8G2_9TREE|nr:uncharacterized protein CI109_001445 [Kwoniella shandongensis]KAA5530042.1 hypothetical protein CI109_001445 [Kwoniella shandongensis]